MRFIVALALSAWLVLTEMDIHGWELPQQPSIELRDSSSDLSSVLSCNLSHAQRPQTSTALPAPEPGLSLALVAIGRGVQVSRRRFVWLCFLLTFR
jgi:hypothetical protein